MKSKEEIIELIVKVKINYSDKKGRKEAIKKAKECCTSSSILGSAGCIPKSAKLHNEVLSHNMVFKK
jgi:uncharacterized OsmC-like protein